MAIFDQSIIVPAVPSAAAAAIKASYPPDTQIITLKPDMLLIALHNEVGYIYLLRPMDNATQLRLITDTADCVREAFRGKPIKDALTSLASPNEASTSPITRQALAARANRQLESVRACIEGKPESQPEPSAPAVFTSSAVLTETSAPPVIPPLKKPLPGRLSKQTLPAGAPWNPDQLSAFVAFFAPASSIAMAINWRRLGKPQWMWPTLLASILVPVIAIGGALGLMSTLPNKSPLSIFSILLIASFNWSYIVGLWSLQRGAYKRWDKTGSVEELLSYRYNFTNAALISGGISLLFMAAGGLAINNSLQPKTFESSEMMITYPSTWAIQDTMQIARCKQANASCIIVVSDARFGYTSIFLNRLVGTETLDAKASEAATWSLNQKKFPRLELEDRGPYTVAGISGYSHTYTNYDATPRHDNLYGIQVFFTRGKALYILTAESLNRGIFNEHRKDIDEFIAGIRLK